MASQTWAYLQYNGPIPQELKNVVKYWENERLVLIVGADGNAHHIYWGIKIIENK